MYEPSYRVVNGERPAEWPDAALGRIRYRSEERTPSGRFRDRSGLE